MRSRPGVKGILLRHGVLFALIAACATLAGPRPAFSQEQEQGGPPPIDLRVEYPPDMTAVEKYDLPVEGVVLTQGVDYFTVVVNDGRPQRITVRENVFAGEVSLDEGLNTLRIGAVVRRVWLATASAKAPPQYRKVYGHFGLDDGCLECHATDDAGGFKLAGDRDEICGWCHGDLIWGSSRTPLVSVHAPIKSGRCLQCHDPHTSEKKGLPSASPPTCGSCHAAVVDRLKSDRFTHGPMNLGDCRICHTVHSSTEPRLLVRPATALCTDCHSDTLAALRDPGALKPHTMIPEGKCSRCHEPHSSVNQRLLQQPAGRLCQECHPGKTRSFHEAKGFSIYICAKCHEMHRPTQPHLIIDASRSLCTQCHDFLGESSFTHSFVTEGKCFLCHSFHEAPLSGTVASLCLGCHRENRRLPKAHRNVAFEKSRCTICHRPHRSPQNKLLRSVEHTPFKQRRCEACHRERAVQAGAEYRQLCTGCHRTKGATAEQAAAEVHKPFKEQDCSGCHTSHNSDEPNLLRVPQGELCLNCHRKMRKSMLLTPVSAHSDVLKGRCGSCHDPHWSANRLLLKKPQAELCVSCHVDLVRAPGGGPWPFSHKPVEEGKCRLCHRNHTSANENLLKVPSPQACRPCHVGFFAGTEDKGIVSRHKPFAAGECGACHQQHGAAQAKFLKLGANDALCRDCHPALKKSAHHDYTAAPKPTTAPGSGCLFCHLPHVSGERRLMVPQKGPVCQACHKT